MTHYHWRYQCSFHVMNNFAELQLLSMIKFSFKGALSGLRQFWATESPLKIMKNPFYFTLKAFPVVKISKFLS